MFDIDFSELKRKNYISESPSYSNINIDFNNLKIDDIIEEFSYYDIDDISAALSIGIATDIYINSKVINEAKGVLKKVVRKGKLVDKIVCPPGFKVNDGHCEKATPKDIIAFARRAKKAAKTRKSRKGAGKSTRMKSMLVRAKNKAMVSREMQV